MILDCHRYGWLIKMTILNFETCISYAFCCRCFRLTVFLRQRAWGWWCGGCPRVSGEAVRYRMAKRVGKSRVWCALVIKPYLSHPERHSELVYNNETPYSAR